VLLIVGACVMFGAVVRRLCWPPSFTDMAIASAVLTATAALSDGTLGAQTSAAVLPDDAMTALQHGFRAACWQ